MNTSLAVKLFKLAMLLLIVGAVIAGTPSRAGIASTPSMTTSAAVIRVVLQDSPGAIELFGHENAHDCVGKGQRR